MSLCGPQQSDEVAQIDAVEIAESIETTISDEAPQVNPAPISQPTDLARLIEGILFAASGPLSAEAIGRIFNDEEKPALGEIRKVLAQLQNEYADRGIHLMEVATGFRFQVADKVAPYIAKNLEEKPARYSRALLETLALIAYRQPITRGEIEDIRGVAVSTNIMKTLDEQEWIRVVGHKDVPGKPGLYATTKKFLDHFGLKNLEELPPLAELKDFDTLVNAISDEESQLTDEANSSEEIDTLENTLSNDVSQLTDEANSTDEISEIPEEISEESVTLI
jgi:segregation and condensation protein B